MVIVEVEEGEAAQSMALSVGMPNRDGVYENEDNRARLGKNKH